VADIKVIIIETADGDLSGEGPAVKALDEGGAAFFPREPSGAWTDAPIDDHEAATAKSLDEALERLASGRELTYLRLDGPDFEPGLIRLLDAADRRTTLAVLAPDHVALYGYGINPEPASIRYAIAWRHLLPTLAAIGEFYLSRDARGQVVFEALKDPNIKQARVDKLKAALGRLEKMLKRESREPWDKHDCA
jgi:hypothetical protein